MPGTLPRRPIASNGDSTAMQAMCQGPLRDNFICPADEYAMNKMKPRGQ